MSVVDLDLLCCPMCRGSLTHAPLEIRCAACGAAWPQNDPRIVDLFQADFQSEDWSGWHDRQQMMVGEYDALVAERDHAIEAYRNDYPPLARRLERIGGRVLDLGGGNGIARHWLPAGVEHIVLDPDTSWLNQPWCGLADAFPCLAVPPSFVRGVAERMPFRDAIFDGVLSIWSLNHTAQPERALFEAARVMRPGGRLLLVLDDVPPTWADLWSGVYPTHDGRERLRVFVRKATAIATGWPRHADHVAVEERALASWARSGLRRVERAWSGPYLIWELERL